MTSTRPLALYRALIVLGGLTRPAARLCCALAAALALGVAPSLARGASPSAFTVNTLGDTADAAPGDGTCADASGACSLRAAIQEANGLAGDDTINFSVNGTINLAGALPDLTSNMTISGPGAALLTVRRDTGGDYRIFTVAPGASVAISGLTVSNGRTPDGEAGSSDSGAGGGILNGGTLDLVGVVVSGNQTGNGVFTSPDTAHWRGGDGGGIANKGVLTLTGATVSGNRTGTSDRVSLAGSPPSGGDGGGIFNSGTMVMSNSTVSGNQTGVGIVNGGPNGNAGSGGAIANIGTLTVSASTITANTTDYAPNSTITGGINCSPHYIFFGTATIRDSIIAGNSGSDLIGAVNSQGHNLIQNAAATFSGDTSTDIFGQSPRLGPLADNGGPTQTHALLPDSPALDTGDSALTTDQRGLPRPADLARVTNAAGGNGSDIGAYEAQPVVTTTAISSDTPAPSVIGQSYTVAFAVTSPAGTPAGSVTVTDGADSCSAALANGSGSCALTSRTAGAKTLTATYPGGSFFGRSSGTAAHQVNKGHAAVTLSGLAQTYDGSPKLVTVSTDPSGLSITVSYMQNGQFVAALDAPTAAGSYDVTATVTDPNYDGTASGTLVVAKAGQTINFAQPADKTFNDAPFALSASATSGLPVGLQLVSGPATLSGNVVTLTGAGTVTIRATQGGDANYNAAAAVERTFTVNKAQATVTLSNLAHAYDGAPKTARVVTSPDGLPVTVAYAQNGQPVSAPTDAGAYSVTATVNDPNYGGSATATLVIAKAATTTALASSPNPSESGQAVTFTATVASGVATPAGTVQFRDGGANLGAPAALAGGTASLTISDLSPGTHAVTAVYSGGANFDTSASAPLAQAVKPQVMISINDVSVAEGNAGTTRADFAVTLSAASSQAVTVNYQTADGTALAGSDYVAASGALTFAPGETAKAVSVLVNGDVSFEPDETFFVNLSGPAGAVLARAQGVGTIVNDDARGGTVQFGLPVYTVGEGAGSLTITVTRAGDVSAAASVAYATADDPAAVRCDDTASNHGAAYARCDYATVAGTLTFAAGETSKTFTVPIIDDAHVEGDETFRVRLANPQGAALGEPSAVTVTIKDNDQPGEPNPLNGTDFFVRQQYLDFLSREPEAGQPWSATINNCPAGDPACDRISVSSNFFRSQEFQLKGLFVFKFYKATFGRMPSYAGIVADMAAVTGNSTAELIAKKAAFTDAFAQRAEFAGLYGAMTHQQFVDALLGRYSLQSITTINPSSPDDTAAPRVALTRDDLVGRLAAGALTRGQVVRAVADSDEVSRAEFNPAFVAMQYFGYLRRDPEPQGYADWLRTINASPSDVRSMVNGFVNSAEYRLRFGQP